ncbi:MAG: hypothetical protein IJH83_05630 [Coriobacteriales bacterium]|nr:hypothetical protein [Coriobacteriales bacterium]
MIFFIILLAAGAVNLWAQTTMKKGLPKTAVMAVGFLLVLMGLYGIIVPLI